MNPNRDKKLSKYLSKVLRHQPERVGISLARGGWTQVDQLLAGCRSNGVDISIDDLLRIANDPENQRYEFDPTGRCIRARYGHSVTLVADRKPAVPPETLFHGTARPNLSRIQAEGILPMGRQMVHLSTTRVDAIRVGGRHGKPVVLPVRARDAHECGGRFFYAGNAVWLVDDVAPDFIGAPEFPQ